MPVDGFCGLLNEKSKGEANGQTSSFIMLSFSNFAAAAAVVATR